MRSSDIVKLVFVVLFTAATIFSCVFAVSLSGAVRDIANGASSDEEEEITTESTTDTNEENGESNTAAEELGKGIGYAFAAAFGMIGAVLFCGISLIGGIISSVICLFGLRSPQKPSKIVFGVFLAINVITVVAAFLGTFLGH